MRASLPPSRSAHAPLRVPKIHVFAPSGATGCVICFPPYYIVERRAPESTKITRKIFKMWPRASGLLPKGVNELGAPLPPDTGGVDATSRRSREASFDGADGVVENGTSFKERIPKHFGNSDHPVCAAVVASHLFLYGAATPPVSGGELP